MTLRGVTLTALFLTMIPSAFSQTLSEAIQSGKPSLQFRPSLEQADVKDNPTDTATSLTTRTRLGYRTGDWSGMGVFLQFQDVSAIIRDYAPLDPEFDTVADPETASLHQAYLEIVGMPGTTVRAGRQEITLDDHRLVGNVDWRQQGQAFDGLSLVNKSLGSTAFTVAGITRVLTPAGIFLDLDSFVIAQADYRGIEGHLIGLHAYLLDSPGGAPTDRDSATYGLRFTGDLPFAEYAADYHVQSSYADAEADRGHMLNAFAAAKFAGFRLGLGLAEITGAESSDLPFDTLFSTAHAHNGWADQFTSTNGGGLANGLEETYLLIGGNHFGTKWEFSYHQFSQQTQGEAYGTELDALLSYPFGANLTGLVKAALYTADAENSTLAGATGKTVYWVRMDYKF